MFTNPSSIEEQSMSRNDVPTLPISKRITLNLPSISFAVSATAVF